jgi:PAS domain S-box-containing protein
MPHELSYAQSNTHEQLASMIESSEDAIMTADLKGVITNWNRGAQHIFGYRADEVIGRSIKILIPRDLQDEEIAIVKRIRRGEKIANYETVRQGKDGRLLEVSLILTPVRNRDGRISGVLTNARDIGSCREVEHPFATEERGRSSDSLETIARQLETIRRDVTRLRSSIDADALNNLDQIDSALSRTAGKLNGVSHRLQVQHIENDGLFTSVKRYIETLGRRTDFKIGLTLQGQDSDLALPLQNAIFRGIQEVLANAYQQASATWFTVNLTSEADQLQLLIRDDRRNASCESHHEELFSVGIGLKWAMTLIRQLGGKLNIHAGPGGTTVYAMIPLDRSAVVKRVKSESPERARAVAKAVSAARTVSIKPREFRDGTKVRLTSATGPSRADRTHELLPLAIEVGGIGIYETDLREGRTRFSPELCTMLGIPTGSEMAYEQAWQVIDERDRAAMRATVEAAEKSDARGKWSSVYRIRRADGEVRWVSMHGRRISQDTANGPEPVRSIGVVVDITHVKETEDALKESELRLRFALEAAQMGTFEADLSASRAIIDAQEARLLGLPEDTRVVSAEEIRKRVPIEDLQASDVQRERLTDHREAYHHEFRLSMPDGSERWLKGHADVRSDRIFGLNFDITQRKLVELALSESEARLRIAIAGAALGVFEWHAETDHAVWENDRMYEIFRRSHSEGALSKKQFVERYLHPDDVNAFATALDQAMKSGERLHTICRINLNHGEQRWLQIDGKFQPSATGSFSRLVAIVADITDRKELEQKARELSECLVTIQEEERMRITQELHDSTVQHLVAANLNLTRLRPQSGLVGDALRCWDETETCLQEAMRELRTFSYLMHPPALQADGLCSALRQYVEGYHRRSGLEVKTRLNPKLDHLPSPLQQAILRIAQEALANAHRHAEASRVTLDVRYFASRIHLTVADDGKGGETVNGRAAFGLGRGLRGMAARAEEHGGELRIRTGARGTKLHALLRDMTDKQRPVNIAARAVAAANSERTRLANREIQPVIDQTHHNLATTHKLRKL